MRVKLLSKVELHVLHVTSCPMLDNAFLYHCLMAFYIRFLLI